MVCLRVIISLYLFCSGFSGLLLANPSNAIKTDVLGTFQYLFEATGPVATIELTTDLFQDDKKVVLIDNHGNIIEHIVLHFNGQLKEQTNFHYNEHRQLIEKTYRDFATANWRAFDRADDELDSRSTYFYDASGMLEREIGYNETTKLTSEIAYRYENNLLFEEYRYGIHGELLARYAYSYDELGNRSEMRFYNASDELGLRYSYQYNTNGKLMETWSHTPSGELLLKYKHNVSEEPVCSYHYDEYQNWIERRCGATTLFRIIEYRE